MRTLSILLCLSLQTFALADIQVTGQYEEYTIDGSLGEPFYVNADIEYLNVINDGIVVLESGHYQTVMMDGPFLLVKEVTFGEGARVTFKDEQFILSVQGRIMLRHAVSPTKLFIENWTAAGNWMTFNVTKPVAGYMWTNVSTYGDYFDLPLDPTGDCAFNIEDLNLIRNDFGLTGVQKGDVDLSGAVDIGDLNTTRNQFGFGFGDQFQGFCGPYEVYGNTFPSPASHAVPEPATGGLVLIGLCVGFVLWVWGRLIRSSRRLCCTECLRPRDECLA